MPRSEAVAYQMSRSNKRPHFSHPDHTQIIRLLSERHEHFKDSPVFTDFIGPVEGLPCPSGIGNGNGISLGIGSGKGLGNGNGKGRGQEFDPINQELQGCAATQQSDFTNNSENAEEEPPF
jgi:hypothetical protein